jgi:hypothetical protein
MMKERLMVVAALVIVAGVAVLDKTAPRYSANSQTYCYQPSLEGSAPSCGLDYYACQQRVLRSGGGCHSEPYRGRKTI